MSAPRLGGLALLALGLLAVAIWFGRHGLPQSESPSQGLLWPGLTEGLADVERLEIHFQDGQAAQVLERQAGRWRVAARDGWWADSARVESLLRELGRARKLEGKTSLKDRYGLLGVAELGSGEQEGEGVALDVTHAGATRRLLVGMANPHSGGRYVRFADEAQAWLVDMPLELPGDARQWLDREILDIASLRVARLEILPWQGDPVEIVRTPGEGAGHRLAGAELASAVDEDRLEEAATLFEGLRLDDVRRDPGVDADPDLDPVRLRLESIDGLVVTGASWREDAVRWVRLGVEFEPQAARGRVEAEIERDQAALAAARQPAVDSGEAAAAPLDPASAGIGPMDPDVRVEALQAEAHALRSRLDGWVFSLPPRKRAIIEASRDAYLASSD